MHATLLCRAYHISDGEMSLADCHRGLTIAKELLSSLADFTKAKNEKRLDFVHNVHLKFKVRCLNFNCFSVIAD